MTCQYNFVEIDKASWKKYWERVQHSTLLQSWEYGLAKSQTQMFRVQRFVLLRDEKPVGLLQALVYSLPIGGIARVNRGPVFFQDFDFLRTSSSAIDAKGIMLAVQKVAKRERWHLLRIAPEFLAKDSLSLLFSDIGFKQRAISPVLSAMINIKRHPEDIRAGFHGKWRNLLKKSEKMELELENPYNEDALAFLINKYEQMQREKNFKGISTKLLKAIFQQEGFLWKCQILFARHGGERHGAVMVVGHGDTCTYLIGWTSQEGRRLQTNYYLLWQAMLFFREFGYSYFDVGGLGSATTKGVEHFKKRLKGNEYSLIGEFSYSNLPFIK